VKVALQTHGGLAAPITMRQPPTVVDTDELPPDAAAELARLMGAAASAAQATRSPGPARDAMSYTITVDNNGKPPTTLTSSDTTMSPEFAALLDWIRHHAPSR
jgi:hypothetical protein